MSIFFNIKYKMFNNFVNTIARVVGGCIVDQIESIREKLYEAMEIEDSEKILKISQELDKLILIYMKKQIDSDKKPAWKYYLSFARNTK